MPGDLSRGTWKKLLRCGLAREINRIPRNNGGIVRVIPDERRKDGVAIMHHKAAVNFLAVRAAW